MIHLMNNVFIDQHNNFDGSVKNFIISKYYYTDELKFINNKMPLESYKNFFSYYVDEYIKYPSHPKTIEAFEDIESLLNHYYDFKNFFVELSKYGKEKVILFCDEITFSHIVTLWLKSILNVNEYSFNYIVDCYEYKQKHVNKDNPALFDMMRMSWSEIDGIDISNIDFKPSFEWLLSSMLYDRNHKFKEKMKEMYAVFIKRDIEVMFIEFIREIDVTILDEDFQKFLGVKDGEYYDITNYKEIPVLKKIFNSSYCTEINNSPPAESYDPSGKYGKIRLDLATEDDLRYLTEFIKNFIHWSTSIIGDPFDAESVTETSSKTLWSVKRNLNSIKTGYMEEEADDPIYFATTILTKTLTEKQYNEIMDYIEQRPFYIPFLAGRVRETVLLIICWYFKSLKRRGRTEELFLFTLK